MPGADPITALRRASAMLLEHGGADVWPVAQAIETWLAEGGDFAAALGLAPGWHSAMRQRERDRAIGELARQHFHTLTGRPLARALAAEGQRYEAGGGWRRNKATQDRPDGRDGLLHDIATHGGMPGESHLRRLFCTGLSAACK